MTLVQIVLILLLLSGFLITTYPSYAPKRGLPIGEILSNETGIVRTLGGLSMIGCLVSVFFFFEWYVALIIIFLVFISGFILVSILKVYTQAFSIIGLFLGLGLLLYYLIF